uniref:Radical SAM core domain-containing protein n=1 Tax=Rhodosorus marinus TaxID=101924 RepID=A0A7S3ABJ7_9RHOD
MGLRRHLSLGEIVDQVVLSKRFFDDKDEAGKRITNIVFMGMGEPLHNTENVIQATNILTSNKGLGLSHNKVTVSTSGLVPEIVRFFKESPANLAVSLNATTDEIRDWIMPINKKYNLASLLGTLKTVIPRRDDGKALKKVSDMALFGKPIVRGGSLAWERDF